MIGVPGRMEPDMSTPTGRIVVWSASSVTSNPVIPSESWMNTETRNWPPEDPERGAGLEGQDAAAG